MKSEGERPDPEKNKRRKEMKKERNVPAKMR